MTWDYRGLYRSGKPANPGTLGPASQALDLEAILDALGWQRVILVGWSMGVQVNFEAWRRFPERIAAIGVINGVGGRPFDTALGSRLPAYDSSACQADARQARLVGKLTGGGHRVGWPGAMLQRLGFVGATIDLALFADFARTYSYAGLRSLRRDPGGARDSTTPATSADRRRADAHHHRRSRHADAVDDGAG